MTELLLLVALSITGLLYAYERQKSVPTHHDPCLHQQGLSGPSTWKPAEPMLFRHRHGKALEWHLGDVAWYLAPKPAGRHHCMPQTCGITETLQHYDRCACGATRFGVWGSWEGRNSRA